MKHCAEAECECDNPQPLSHFYKNKKSKDGHASFCKSCTGRHKRKGYIPIRERVKLTQFQKTMLFGRLNAASCCLGMARRPLREACAVLKIKATDFTSKETYQQAESAMVLLKQALTHIDWLVEAGERDNDNE